jgi:hypothetical protein
LVIKTSQFDLIFLHNLINFHTFQCFTFVLLSFEFGSQFTSDSSGVQSADLVFLELAFQVLVELLDVLIETFNVLFKLFTDVFEFTVLSLLFLLLPLELAFSEFPIPFLDSELFLYMLSFVSFLLLFLLSLFSLLFQSRL